MIRLTDLAGKGSFTMGGKKFEYGKVYSNPFATAFKPVNEAEESEDHEVSMAQNQLDSIIKHATELKQKMGEEEKQIPAWIQDHITNSENYISQAASNYHEYGDSNEEVNEAPAQTKGEKIQRYNDRVKKLRDKISSTKNSEQKMKYQTTLKGILQRLSDIRKDHGIKAPHSESVTEIKFDEIKVLSKEEFQNEDLEADILRDMQKSIKNLQYMLTKAKNPKEKENLKANIAATISTINWYKNKSKYESVNEAGPCWKGYKQVGMKNKNGKEVPNCVPEGKTSEGVNEISARTPKIFVKTAAVEKKIKELMADRKKAVIPYNKETDPAKKEKLKQVLIKLTNQIKGYEKNLVQLRDMEEEYLQQMHADAELDTTGL